MIKPEDFKEGNYAIRTHNGCRMFQITEEDLEIMKNHLDKYDSIKDVETIKEFENADCRVYYEDGNILKHYFRF